MTTTSESRLTKNQKRQFGPVKFKDHGRDYSIVAEVRHDDQCGNGHNDFSITAEISRYGVIEMCGCCHNEVSKHFPELDQLIKWHLCGTDGPMHYIANAEYWAGHCGWRKGGPSDPPNIGHLKATIVYGALPSDADFDLSAVMYDDRASAEINAARKAALDTWLTSRLPALLEAFRRDVESLGFTY